MIKVLITFPSCNTVFFFVVITTMIAIFVKWQWYLKYTWQLILVTCCMIKRNPIGSSLFIVHQNLQCSVYSESHTSYIQDNYFKQNLYQLISSISIYMYIVHGTCYERFKVKKQITFNVQYTNNNNWSMPWWFLAMKLHTIISPPLQPICNKQ